jgi:hypothetical protein
MVIKECETDRYKISKGPHKIKYLQIVTHLTTILMVVDADESDDGAVTSWTKMAGVAVAAVKMAAESFVSARGSSVGKDQEEEPTNLAGEVYAVIASGNLKKKKELTVRILS